MVFSRCIWVMLLIGGCIGVVYQVFCCVALFLRYPVSTSVHIKQSSCPVFPAVTICNLNKFRYIFIKSNYLFGNQTQA